MANLKFFMDNVVLIIFYLLHLYYFFGVILWGNGGQIYSKCVGFWVCRHQLSRPSPVWLSEHLGIIYHPDLSDNQWREFRQSLPLLGMVAIGTTFLSWFCRFICHHVCESNHTMILVNTILRLIVGILAIVIQHGFHSLIIFGICLIGYGLSRCLLNHRTDITSPTLSQQNIRTRLWISKSLVWIYAIIVLLFKESYRIRHLPAYSFLNIFFDKKYSGMYGWQLPANFLVLRWISYAIDYFEALEKYYQYEMQKKTDIVVPDDTNDSNTDNHTKLPKRERITDTDDDDTALHVTHPVNDYSFIYYMCYMTYAPLYMAGPIVSFNSFISSSRQPQRKVNVFKYGMRWILCFCILEWMTSRFPFFATVSTGLLPHLSIQEIASVFYLILKMMWLKFLTIWRFFRLWSLSDGIFTIENQQRCMSNNFSLTQFWKGWHASFNKWLVRYLYKPLGGRKYQYLNVWIIFFFVGLWHDLEWKLMVWGLLNAVFYVIEVLVIQPVRERLLDDKKISSISNFIEETPKLHQTHTEKTPTIMKVARHILVTVMGAFFIIVLISVNLIGYSVGTGGIHLVTEKAMTLEGLYVFVGSLYFLSIGVSIMLYLQYLGIAKK